VLARAAERAERYQDMAAFMHHAVLRDNRLTIESRNLLSVAYKNVISKLRSSLRITNSQLYSQCQCCVKNYYEAQGPQCPIIEATTKMAVRLEREIAAWSFQMLRLVEEHLLPTADKGEDRIHYLKMKGDTHRNLGELTFEASQQWHELALSLRHTVAQALAPPAWVTPTLPRLPPDIVFCILQHAIPLNLPLSPHVVLSMEAYDAAAAEMKASLPCTNPIRLGMALSWATFTYDILGKHKKAIATARDAFNEAVQHLDDLDEDLYRDSTLIMQLLRDNFTLWEEAEAEDLEDE